jgi:hypothetical protein
MSEGDARAPKITGWYPVLGIRSYDEALAYYVEFLGFNLDWEWRRAPGSPVIMSVSRDRVSLGLNESHAPGSWLNLFVTDVQALADEWNGRRPNSVTVVVEPPYDIPTIQLTDPFGNRMHFQQPVDAVEQETRRGRAVPMREYIRQRLAAGHPCPTPEEVVRAVGRPLGIAIEVLNEFPEYRREHGAPD